MAELGLLVSARVLERHGESLGRAAREGELELRPVVLPVDPEGRVSPAECARVEAAYFSGDVFPDGARAFFASEPLAAESPLWSLPNVIATPHNSAASRGNEARQVEIFLENLARFGRGELLRNEVRT